MPNVATDIHRHKNSTSARMKPECLVAGAEGFLQQLLRVIEGLVLACWCSTRRRLALPHLAGVPSGRPSVCGMGRPQRCKGKCGAIASSNQPEVGLRPPECPAARTFGTARLIAPLHVGQPSRSTMPCAVHCILDSGTIEAIEHLAPVITTVPRPPPELTNESAIPGRRS